MPKGGGKGFARALKLFILDEKFTQALQIYRV
jgi:hypothetical protein